MNQKEKEYYSVRGLFRCEPEKSNLKSHYEEITILVKAFDHDHAETMALKYFKDYEDEMYFYTGQMNIIRLSERPKIGDEIFWFKRYTEISPKKYVEKYWNDLKPNDCDERGWKHAWYNKDGKNSACYNCNIIKPGKLWQKGK